MSEPIREHRATKRAATIVKRSEGGDCVEGYGAVFYDGSEESQYRMYDDLVERIDPACFNRAIAEKHPCRCLVNHDPNMRLGRADKGTLRLSVDKTGLQYSCDPPDTQVGRDTMTDLANGNLDGSSFSFSVRGQRWEDIKQEDGSWLTIRTLTDVDLYDCGPVAFPAYEGTTAGLRSTETAEDVKAQRDAWRRAESEKRNATTLSGIEMRIREVAVREAMET